MPSAFDASRSFVAPSFYVAARHALLLSEPSGRRDVFDIRVFVNSKDFQPWPLHRATPERSLPKSAKSSAGCAFSRRASRKSARGRLRMLVRPLMASPRRSRQPCSAGPTAFARAQAHSATSGLRQRCRAIRERGAHPRYRGNRTASVVGDCGGARRRHPDRHGSPRPNVERDGFKLNRHRALDLWWSMIFSENRCPPRIKSGEAFSGSCSSSPLPFRSDPKRGTPHPREHVHAYPAQRSDRPSCSAPILPVARKTRH